VHGLNKIQLIEAGRHAAAIDVDGKLFVWGPCLKENPYLEQTNTLEPKLIELQGNCISVSVGSKISTVVCNDKVYTWGTCNKSGQLGSADDLANGVPK